MTRDQVNAFNEYRRTHQCMCFCYWLADIAMLASRHKMVLKTLYKINYHQ